MTSIVRQVVFIILLVHIDIQFSTAYSPHNPAASADKCLAQPPQSQSTSRNTHKHHRKGQLGIQDTPSIWPTCMENISLGPTNEGCARDCAARPGFT